MKIPIFKIRASASINIMAGIWGITEIQQTELDGLFKKSKIKVLTEKQQEKIALLIYKKDNPELSEGCKTYLEMWLKEKVYNRQKEITSKHMEKGLVVEDNSLDFVAKQLGIALLIKNEKHYEDDFMTGTPDAVQKDFVIDVKNSWSPFTFPLFAADVPENAYYLQAQIYMHLTGKSKYKLIYTLMDTPEYLIEREAKSYSYNNGYGDLTQEMLDDFIKKMTYKDIPDTLKYKPFTIERNDEVIKEIQERVLECRKYIENLIAMNSL